MRHHDSSNVLIVKFFVLVLVLAVAICLLLGGVYYFFAPRSAVMPVVAASPTPAPATPAAPTPAPTPEDTLASFGVSPAEFLADAPFGVILHTDTLMLLMQGRNIAQANGLQVSLPAIRDGQLAAFAAGLYVPSHVRKRGETQRYCDQAPRKLAEVVAANPLLAAAGSVDELRRNWQEGKVSVFLTMEGSWCLQGDLSRLELYRQLGVRMIALTWKGDNRFATNWGYAGPDGLTALGRQALQLMNRLGIAVDVSHMSDAAIRDVLAQASAPVFASHANCRAICNHPRNLTDGQIKGIAATGGVIGVNFYALHLCGNNLREVVRHLEHLRQVGGIGCLALGTDYDGIEQQPPQLDTVAGLPRLRAILGESGFTEEEIKAICGGNFLRALLQVERRAKELQTPANH